MRYKSHLLNLLQLIQVINTKARLGRQKEELNGLVEFSTFMIFSMKKYSHVCGIFPVLAKIYGL